MANFNLEPMLIATFGNPLLDFSVIIDDNSFFEKYNIKIDDQAEIPKESISLIFEELSQKYAIDCNAGGCAQNTSQILQWILKKPGLVLFFGGIGNDKNGEKIKSILEKANVKTRYAVHATNPTGICVAIIYSITRTLLANIGAAQIYNVSDLQPHLSDLDKVKLLYIESFFLTGRIQTVEFLFNFARKNNKTFIFNLSGVYLIEEDPKNVSKYAINSDILFGNICEYKALAKHLNLDKNASSEDIGIYLNHSYNNLDEKRIFSQHKKVVVMTDGSKKVTCTYGDAFVCDINVPELKDSEIKDTTGAGDSFLAGFLAGLLLNKSVPIALKWGCWTARQIIQQVGCSPPKYEPDEIYKLQ